MGQRKQITPDKHTETSVEPQKYFSRFLIGTEVNHWDEDKQGLYLAGNLTGQPMR